MNLCCFEGAVLHQVNGSDNVTGALGHPCPSLPRLTGVQLHWLQHRLQLGRSDVRLDAAGKRAKTLPDFYAVSRGHGWWAAVSRPAAHKTGSVPHSPVQALLRDVRRLPGDERHLLGESYNVLPSSRAQLKCKELPVGLILQDIFKHTAQALPVPLRLRGQQHILGDRTRWSHEPLHSL